MMNRTISRRALMQWALGGAAVLQGISWTGLAQAAATGQLRIGMAAPPTTLDPHLKSNAPNNALATHIYDTLVTNDEKSISRPGLATAWRAADDTHWEFDLRPDVRFSDGEPLTVDDIVVSFDRANTIDSTASFRTYTRNIKSITSPKPASFSSKPSSRSRFCPIRSVAFASSAPSSRIPRAISSTTAPRRSELAPMC